VSTTALRTPLGRRGIVIAAATIAVSSVAVVAPTSATIAASASGLSAGTSVAGSITAAGAAAVVGAVPAQRAAVPAVRKTAPVVGKAAPVVRKAATAVRKTAPVVRKTTTAVRKTAPAARAAAPAAPVAAPASRSTTRAAVSPYRVGTKAHSQWFARSYMSSTYGWTGAAQYTCLVKLWTRESGWSHTAHNGNGAHGIPQALPGRKMASAGPNWQSNPETQIKWGLRYIKGRYGSPCGAWSHFTGHGWY
jgi:hypothetical protein